MGHRRETGKPILKWCFSHGSGYWDKYLLPMEYGPFYVYMLTNYGRTVLYTGVSNDLRNRMQQHINRINPGCFTARYNVCFLVYFEEYSDIREAIAREKTIKKWSRADKWALIKTKNPGLLFYNVHTLRLPAAKPPRGPIG
jgi:putative endonuclease